MSGYTPEHADGSKPLLMLGISGVIALDGRAEVPATRVRLTAWGKWAREVTVALDAAAKVAALSERFQIVWASEWGHVAHEAFCEVLNLPRDPWPFLPVQFDKLPAIENYAGRRRWAWIDEPAADLARPVPSSAGGVVLRVDPAVGISSVDPDGLIHAVDALFPVSG